MNQGKSKKKSRWGGKRRGSGRPKGAKKAKVSVSVDSDALENALKLSGEKPSALFNSLLKTYVELDSQRASK